jgi:hypothetical protein
MCWIWIKYLHRDLMLIQGYWSDFENNRNFTIQIQQVRIIGVRYNITRFDKQTRINWAKVALLDFDVLLQGFLCVWRLYSDSQQQHEKTRHSPKNAHFCNNNSTLSLSLVVLSTSATEQMYCFMNDWTSNTNCRHFLKFYIFILFFYFLFTMESKFVLTWSISSTQTILF